MFVLYLNVLSIVFGGMATVAFDRLTAVFRPGPLVLTMGAFNKEEKTFCVVSVVTVLSLCG